MGALPTPPPAHPHAVYLEELHEFFADQHLYFGMPADILPLVERLKQPGDFRERMTAVVQTIRAREGRPLPTAELLEIVAVGIGGPQIQQSPPDLHQPLSDLYDFLAAVPTPEFHEVIPSGGELLNFPGGPLPSSLVPGPDTAGDRLEADFVVASLRPRSGEEAGLETIDLPRRPGPITPFRMLVLAAGIAILAAILLALFLRPKAPAAPAAPIHVSGATTVVHPSKPSAYGEAFNPTPQARRHRSHPKTASADDQPAGGSGTQHENATR